ncbi:MAG: hypothetical protein HYV32_05300 [Candidatus Kerfeldbacteria bacterium]|nr:hypothetical protein [Candidatus Kerfeldbacteria bacterium]
MASTTLTVLDNLIEAHTAWEEQGSTESFNTQWLRQHGYQALLQTAAAEGGIDNIAQCLPDDLREDFFAHRRDSQIISEPNYSKLLLLLNQKEPITIDSLSRAGYKKLARILSSAIPERQRILDQLPESMRNALIVPRIEFSIKEATGQFLEAYHYWCAVVKLRKGTQFNNLFLEQSYPLLYTWILKNPEQFQTMLSRLPNDIQQIWNPERMVEARAVLQRAKTLYDVIQPEKSFFNWIQTTPKYALLIKQLEHQGLLDEAMKQYAQELARQQESERDVAEIKQIWQEGIILAFQTWQDQQTTELFNHEWLKKYAPNLFNLIHIYPAVCVIPPETQLQSMLSETVQHQGAEHSASHKRAIFNQEQRTTLKQSTGHVMRLQGYFYTYIEKRLFNELGYIPTEDVEDIAQSFWQRLYTPDAIHYPSMMSQSDIAALQAEQTTDNVVPDKVLAEVMKRLYAHVTIWLTKQGGRSQMDNIYKEDAPILDPTQAVSDPALQLDMRKFLDTKLTPAQIDFLEHVSYYMNHDSSEERQEFLATLNRVREETGKNVQGRRPLTPDQVDAKDQAAGRLKREIQDKADKFFR